MFVDSHQPHFKSAEQAMQLKFDSQNEPFLEKINLVD